MRHLATHCHICTYLLKNILISVGKQFLNNNKHIKLNTNVDTILTGIRRQTHTHNPHIMNTEGEGLIDLNIQPFRYIGHQSSAPDKKRFLCKILKASRKLQKEFRTKVYKY